MTTGLVVDEELDVAPTSDSQPDALALSFSTVVKVPLEILEVKEPDTKLYQLSASAGNRVTLYTIM